MRTTSSLEGVNSVIQKSFPARTTIFKFAESLRLYEAMKSTDLYQISTGEINTPQLQRRRTADRERNEKIEFLTKEFNNGNISVADFLVSMSDKDILPPSGTYAEQTSKLNNPSTYSSFFLSLPKSKSFAF